MQEPKSYPLIPDEAFLLTPQPADIVRSKQRLIFQGGISYSQIQNEKLSQFKIHVDKHKIQLDPFWTPPSRLRFLQSCQYNNEKTIKDMNAYLDWVKKSHPLELTEKIQNALEKGLIYFTGRDYKYRPIIVFDVKKTLDSKLPSDDIIDVYTYYLDFVVNNLLVEGHVQNWILIVDLNGSGVFSTVGMLQKVLAAMSNRFRCRMHSCHLVRCPGTFAFLWALVKKFLDEVAIEKISFSSKNKPQNLLGKCNASQVQKKYGGATNDFSQFWPVTIRSRAYDIQNLTSVLISVEQYRKLFKTSQLVNQKINKNLVQSSEKQKQREKQKDRNIEREKETTQIKHNSGESFLVENKAFRQTNKFPRTTLYEQHSSAYSSVRQESIRISVQTTTQYKQSNFEDYIEEEPAINEIIHFTLNMNKPITFSSYAL